MIFNDQWTNNNENKKKKQLLMLKKIFQIIIPTYYYEFVCLPTFQLDYAYFLLYDRCVGNELS